MNKISLSLALIALILSISSFFYFKSDSELVYVDINKLMDGYKRTSIEKSKFEEKAKLMQSNVDSLVADWQNELKIYEKERLSLSKKEQELKEELLGNKQERINNYQKAIQGKIKEEDQKGSQTILNDINDYVKEYGEKHKYRIIFGASGSGNIMFANEKSDLTEEILDGLNKEFLGK
ncbi:OmpH family outer membrane protein [Aequorivita sp. CIP111184]|uniref:OmpH family outer membrane protein n=1 Tax=Aequorivita sp. CIP111184 TaxID=2211356 RepID=UPI000DBBE245|nr:OmpH family outer membrane protein [Aequorivita sp. CIP111184]SRX52231.1 hypothetical protein AEQU1_00094 [Aequorivita sp. CIP111184]